MGQRGLGGQAQAGRERAQPLGPQAHLLRGLLGRDVERPCAPDGHRGRHLQQQRRLADAGLAADQRDRAGDEAAAEHPVDLGQTPVERGCHSSASTSAMGTARSMAATTRRRRAGVGTSSSSTRVFHSSHDGQRPTHLGAGPAALAAPEHGTDLGHVLTLLRGYDSHDGPSRRPSQAPSSRRPSQADRPRPNRGNDQVMTQSPRPSAAAASLAFFCACC